MAHGFRVKHPTTGQVLVEVSDRLTRVVGTFATGTSDGSFTLPSSIEGDSIFFSPVSYPSIYQRYAPSISRSGRTISWTFVGSVGDRVSVTVLYGVY